MTFQSFTAAEYLKIDVANNFGLDHENWDVRLAWFDNNEHQLRDIVRHADCHALYQAGVQAWEDYKAGKPIGYAVSLDATSSGIQLLSCLVSDPQAASLCNVIDTGNREDAYLLLYHAMVKRIGEAAKIERKATKLAIMAAFYTSRNEPRRVFGDGPLLEAFYDTVREEAPGAWELNETFLAIWDNTKDLYSWVLPDNFHVHVKVMGTNRETVNFLNRPYEVSYSSQQPVERGRFLGAHTAHCCDALVVRELRWRCHYDPAQLAEVRRVLGCGSPLKTLNTDGDKLVKILWDHYLDSGFLSARILRYLTYSNVGHVDPAVVLALMDTLPKKPFNFMPVHDCFRVHPNYGNDIRRQYNQLLHDIAKSDLLSFIMSQQVGRRVKIGKMDPEMYKKILEANYALS